MCAFSKITFDGGPLPERISALMKDLIPLRNYVFATVVSLGLTFSARAQLVLTNCTGEAFSNAVANESHIIITCDGVITAPAQLIVTHDLVIESTSSNASIRGHNGERLFFVNSNVNLTLLNVTFADSFSTNIGAVFFNRGGNISARNCLFRNNVARGPDAVLSVPSPARSISGGVVFQSDGGTFTAIDCVFDQNSATGGNGVNGSSAANGWGNAGQGGVAYISTGTASFTNCFFTRNTAVGGSGREVNGGAFGGAVVWSADTTGAVVACTFSNNTAYALNPVFAFGGRVEAGALWTTGQVFIALSTFVSNRVAAGSSGAAYGGAIHNEFELQIERCTFIGNEAVGGDTGNNAVSFAIAGGPGLGGAIMSEGSFSASDCHFEWNKALAGNGGRTANDETTFGGVGHGGACAALAPARSIYMTNCSFVGQFARGGNGGQFTQTALGGNASGGAVYSLATNHVFENCTVGWTTNVAGNGGSPNGQGGWARGAFYFTTGAVLISHCSFASNALVAGTGLPAGRAYATDIFNQQGNVSLFTTLLGNGFGSTNVSGPFIDLGFNLCADDSLAISNANSRTNITLLIGPPAFNGGSIHTMALLPGSPARDAIPVGTPGVAATDARRLPRPQNGASDIGAFEFNSGLSEPWLEIAAGTGVVDVAVFAKAGNIYRLLAAPTIPNTNWVEVAALLAQSNGPVRAVISNTVPQRFFQAVTP